MESATVGRRRDKRAYRRRDRKRKRKRPGARGRMEDSGRDSRRRGRSPGRRRSARGCPRGLRGHRVHAYLSIKLDPVFEGLDAELSPAAHRARLVVSSTGRDEIRAPADPPPHPRDAPLGLRLGGFSVTPLDDSRAPRARDERTLAKAPLATGPLRGSPRARGCALAVRARLFFQAAPGTNRPRVVDPEFANPARSTALRR
jgi:hypothetical protein